MFQPQVFMLAISCVPYTEAVPYFVVSYPLKPCPDSSAVVEPQSKLKGPRPLNSCCPGVQSTFLLPAATMENVVLVFVHGNASRPPYWSCGGGLYPPGASRANAIAPEMLAA